MAADHPWTGSDRRVADRIAECLDDERAAAEAKLARAVEAAGGVPVSSLSLDQQAWRIPSPYRAPDGYSNRHTVLFETTADAYRAASAWRLIPPSDPPATVPPVGDRQTTRQAWEDAVREYQWRLAYSHDERRSVQDVAAELLAEIRGPGLRLTHLDREPKPDAEKKGTGGYGGPGR